MIEALSNSFGYGILQKLTSGVLNASMAKIQEEKQQQIEILLTSALRESGFKEFEKRLDDPKNQRNFVFNCHRYQRSAFEGSANANLRTLARLLVGAHIHGNGSDFPPWCERISGLSEAELDSLSKLYIVYRSLDETERVNCWKIFCDRFANNAVKRDLVIAQFSSSMRSGLVQPVTVWSGIGFKITPYFDELMNTTNLKDLMAEIVV